MVGIYACNNQIECSGTREIGKKMIPGLKIIGLMSPLKQFHVFFNYTALP